MSRTASANRPVRPALSARTGTTAGRSPRHSAEANTSAPVLPSASTLIAVMSELQTLVCAENDSLRRGLPATALETTERKEHLHAKFRSMFRYVLRSDAPTLSEQEAQRLQELGVSLRALAVENAARYDAALKASQQRVEQVMDALRQKISQDHASYGRDFANVHTLRAHFTDYGRSLEV